MLAIVLAGLLVAQSATPPPAPKAPPSPASPPASGGSVAPKPPTLVEGTPFELPAPPPGARQLGGDGTTGESTEPAPALPTVPPVPSMHDELAEAARADARRREILEEQARRLFPSPLPREELESWGRSLGLGPEALDHLGALHARYLDRLTASQVRDALSMVAASFEWSDEGDRLVPRWTPVHVAMLAERAASATALATADAALTAELLSLLPAERQRDGRRLASRRQLAVGAPPAGDGLAALDVTALVDDCPLSPEDRAVALPTLDAHVGQLSDLLATRRRAHLDRDLEEARLRVGLGPMWQAGLPDEDVADLEMELRALAEAAVAADAPLRDLNLATLARLGGQLSPAGQWELVQRLWLRVHPALFEEERTLAALAAASAEDADATPAQRRQRHDALASESGRLLRAALDVLATTEGAAGRRATVLGRTSEERAEAIDRLALESQRLTAGLAKRAICRQAARSVGMRLGENQADLAARCRTLERTLELRDSADEWTLRRYRERTTELRRREASELAAAEEAERKRLAALDEADATGTAVADDAERARAGGAGSAGGATGDSGSGGAGSGRRGGDATAPPAQAPKPKPPLRRSSDAKRVPAGGMTR